MVKGKDLSKEISRRNFLIKLGGVTGLVITGSVFTSQVLKKLNTLTPVKNDSAPVLIEKVKVKYSNSGAEIIRPGIGGRPVCFVNEIGSRIIKEMDGYKNIKDIAKSVAKQLKIVPDNRDAFTGSIAIFITELAKLGLLREPFYINLIVNEFTT